MGALAVFLTIGMPLAALAQNHTQEDEAACTPDVMRLCQEFIPNRPAIISCMISKKKDLGPECSAVFARPPSARAAEDDRRRKRKSDPYTPN